MLVIKHVAHVISSSTAMDFLTNTSKKHKSTSPCASQVKKSTKSVHIPPVVQPYSIQDKAGTLLSGNTLFSMGILGSI
jgi:hypothetical protein